MINAKRAREDEGTRKGFDDFKMHLLQEIVCALTNVKSYARRSIQDIRLVRADFPSSDSRSRTFFSRVVKKGSVVSILRVSTKRGGDDEKTAGVSAEIR
jgi:hypothetical protein